MKLHTAKQRVKKSSIVMSNDKNLSRKTAAVPDVEDLGKIAVSKTAGMMKSSRDLASSCGDCSVKSKCGYSAFAPKKDPRGIPPKVSGNLEKETIQVSYK